VPIESKAVSRSIRSAQTQVEQQNFEIRKDVLKYDDVLNRQRQVIYGERRTVLEGADLHEQIRQMIDEVVTAYVAGATSDGFPEEWDLEQLWTAFRDLYHPTLTVTDVVEEAGGEKSALSQEFIAEFVKADAQDAYDRREAELTPEVMRELERRVVLAVLDHKWREHLYEMDYLREGIGLRAMAQRDPLVEYQREGFDMFNTMMEGIKEESVAYLFNSQVEVQQNPIVEEAPGEVPAVSSALGPVTDAVTPNGGGPQTDVAGSAPAGSAPADSAPAGTGPGAGAGRRGTGGRGGRGARRRGGGRHAATGRAGGAPEADGPAPEAARPAAAGTPSVVAPGLSRPKQPGRLSYSAPTVDGEAQVERRADAAAGGDFGKVGRNAPCPCGSGRKYKLCHGDPRNRPAG
jgi:preprotein translocase subunit SecA